MSADLVILVTSSITNLLLGSLVFLRNPSQAGNRRFAFLSASLVSWTVFNYLADHASSNNLLFTRLTFLGGVSAIFSVIYFARYFPRENVVHKGRLINLQALFTIVMIPIVFLPGFVESVTKGTQGVAVSTSYLYPIFIAYVILSLVVLFTIIRKQFYGAKSPIQKQQARLVFFGVALYAILAISSNVILPAVIDNWSSSRFGPAFTLLFIGMVAYAIAKHRLFDIRLIIARSVVYLLLLGTLSLIFAGSLLVLTTIFFKDDHVSGGIKVIYVVIALIMALALQPIKRFFDKVTNKIFYRDSYDSQELLNELNKSLVTTIDLSQLLSMSTQIVSSTLKTEYCTFAIKESHLQDLRIIGGSSSKFDTQAVQHIVTMAASIPNKIVVADELLPSKHLLKDLMQQNNLAILAKLQGSNQGHAQQPGYILLGQKQSGGLYSSQDLQVLEIIADELVIAIQNALRFEEIQQFNITLQQKVEDATKQLKMANSRLRELDKTKDEFISMASHQLRTPLTTVKGYLSMILDGDMGPVKKEQKEMMQHAFDGANRMVYLIADLLNVSRLQTGKFVIDNKPTNLVDVVEGEISQLTDQAKTRQVELIYKKPEQFPILNLDETKIRQVVMNFLDNAIYYTPKGGKVEAALSVTPTSVSYTVTDTGVGVPKDVQHHLFTKFYRADNARKVRPDGTGLGLFMAKKVIVAQGGATIFKSTEGKGSTFGFSLPRKSMELKGEQAAVTEVSKNSKVAKSIKIKTPTLKA